MSEDPPNGGRIVEGADQAHLAPTVWTRQHVDRKHAAHQRRPGPSVRGAGGPGAGLELEGVVVRGRAAVAELEHDAAVLGESEPILRDGAPQQLPAELVEALTILPVHGDISVKVEPVEVSVPGPTGGDSSSIRVLPQEFPSMFFPS